MLIKKPGSVTTARHISKRGTICRQSYFKKSPWLKLWQRGLRNSIMVEPPISAGDPLPPKCAVIEVHVGELKQLFDAIDPSPFRDRDLDPKAEEFIVGW